MNTSSILASRLLRFMSLDEQEVAFLASLEVRRLQVRARTTVRRAGDMADEFYVLMDGWVMTHSQLPDGTRQVRRLHFPGDLIAMPSVALRHHAEDIEAVTDTTLAPFDKQLVGTLFERFPRLGALMFLFAQSERIAFGDRLTCLGRCDSKGRLAYLLLDVLNRLRSIDPTVDRSFRMHLTREQMADATGMTAVHASRMWSELLSERLIAQDGPVVTIVDEPGLVALCNYVNRTSELDFSWVPGIQMKPFRWEISDEEQSSATLTLPGVTGGQ